MESIEASIEDRVRNLFGEERFERIMLEQKKDTRSILIGKRKEYQMLEGVLSRFCEEQASSEFEYLTPDEIIVKQGDIVEEILSTAQENDSEMIILSQHKKDLSEQCISQTIQDVVLRTTIPLLIIPPQD
jgi:poly(3-hydroxyalkanoate) synthetase